MTYKRANKKKRKNRDFFARSGEKCGLHGNHSRRRRWYGVSAHLAHFTGSARPNGPRSVSLPTNYVGRRRYLASYMRASVRLVAVITAGRAILQRVVKSLSTCCLAAHCVLMLPPLRCPAAAGYDSDDSFFTASLTAVTRSPGSSGVASPACCNTQDTACFSLAAGAVSL